MALTMSITRTVRKIWSYPKIVSSFKFINCLLYLSNHRQNPDQKPLNELKFPVQENGVVLEIPALVSLHFNVLSKKQFLYQK